MINILVDEAYAFDYLSILEIKKNKDIRNQEIWLSCLENLRNQFEIKKWISMITSEEYKEIVKANKLTFDAVEKAKNNEVGAQYVDFCNYQRYVAKQNFQKKFFNEELAEQKIGYEKYENSSTNSSKK